MCVHACVRVCVCSCVFACLCWVVYAYTIQLTAKLTHPCMVNMCFPWGTSQNLRAECESWNRSCRVSVHESLDLVCVYFMSFVMAYKRSTMRVSCQASRSGHGFTLLPLHMYVYCKNYYTYIPIIYLQLTGNAPKLFSCVITQSAHVITLSACDRVLNLRSWCYLCETLSAY